MGSLSLHAPLPPSGAYRWAPDDGCRGAAHMEARYPQDTESEAAREGTAAHHYVGETLIGRTVAIGSTAPNGETVTQEMVSAGALMIADCQRVATLYGKPLHIEQRVTMGTVHADCWGTPDAHLIDTEKCVLVIWDYKYGHRYVDPFRNFQLILYAIGALEAEGVPATEWWRYRIALKIVQPRNFHPSGHVREQSLSGTMLAQTFLPQLRKAAIEARAQGAPLRTGDHCRDCLARHACPALARSAALSVDIAHQQTPMDLTPPALGLELRYLKDAEKRIKARCDALEEQALGMVRSGKDVPLWRADYSSGRERFTVPVDQVIAMGDMFGVVLAKPVDCVTPKQARDAGMPEQVIAGISATPRGSMKLVPVTDDSVARAFE